MYEMAVWYPATLMQLLICLATAHPCEAKERGSNLNLIIFLMLVPSCLVNYLAWHVKLS